MIYFTSDLHFGHGNIIRHCSRPFASADEMDAALIKNWNETVTPNDDVYILGDLTMRPANEAHRYLSELNGRKYLIRGNHDRRFLKSFDKYADDFVWIKDYFLLNCENKYFVLFHYPIAEWDGFYRKAIHCYGHIHNSAAKHINAISGLAFNVGVDVNDYKPVSIMEILRKASQQ